MKSLAKKFIDRVVYISEGRIIHENEGKAKQISLYLNQYLAKNCDTGPSRVDPFSDEKGFYIGFYRKDSDPLQYLLMKTPTPLKEELSILAKSAVKEISFEKELGSEKEIVKYIFPGYTLNNYIRSDWKRLTPAQKQGEVVSVKEVQKFKEPEYVSNFRNNIQSYFQKRERTPVFDNQMSQSSSTPKAVYDKNIEDLIQFIPQFSGKKKQLSYYLTGNLNRQLEKMVDTSRGLYIECKFNPFIENWESACLPSLFANIHSDSMRKELFALLNGGGVKIYPIKHGKQKAGKFLFYGVERNEVWVNNRKDAFNHPEKYRGRMTGDFQK